jgi:hypothetical protein
VLNKEKSMRMATNPMGVLDYELDMDLEMEAVCNDQDDQFDQLDTVNDGKNKSAKKSGESNA